MHHWPESSHINHVGLAVLVFLFGSMLGYFVGGAYEAENLYNADYEKNLFFGLKKKNVQTETSSTSPTSTTAPVVTDKTDVSAQTTPTSASATYDGGPYSFSYPSTYTIVQSKAQSSTAGRAVDVEFAVLAKDSSSIFSHVPISIEHRPQGLPAVAPTLDEALQDWEEYARDSKDAKDIKNSKGVAMKRLESQGMGGITYVAVAVDRFSYYRFVYSPAFEDLPVSESQMLKAFEEILDTFEVKLSK